MNSVPQPRSLERLIGNIDRRVVYLGLFLMTLLPLILRPPMPLYVTDPPKKLYQTIEELPPDKLVLLSSDWDAGSQAESRPQLVAVARHLIRRNLKVAILSIGYPASPQLSQTAVEQAIREEGAQDRYRYGEQWVNLGYKLPEPPWLRSFANNVPDAVKDEWLNGKPLSEIPVMRGVDKFGPDGQISMIMCVTGQDTITRYYQFLGPTKVKIALGCTAVMAPEQYPYLDSGQLSGLLTGMKGGAEYEQLIQAPSFGTAAMAGQSFAHLYMLILVVLGNIAVVLGRRRRPAR